MSEQTLVEHLIELRRRLVWTVAVLLLCFLALMPFSQQLYTFVAKPLMASLPQNTSMIATDVIAPFFVPVKVTLMTAFLLSLPHTLYQIWAFVAPGLMTTWPRSTSSRLRPRTSRPTLSPASP